MYPTKKKYKCKRLTIHYPMKKHTVCVKKGASWFRSVYKNIPIGGGY